MTRMTGDSVSELDDLAAPAMRRYDHIIEAVFGSVWAILPEKLYTIAEIVKMRARGITFSAEEIESRTGGRPARRPASRRGAIAVLPLYGVISQRMNLMTAISGGTSTEMFAAAFREVIADDGIEAVVIDIDSPGGSVFGVQELAQEIFDARGRKPIVAIADSMAASAAYWIGTAAGEFVLTPSGMVGSIGVVSVHEDMSRNLEMEGFKITLISAGKFKTEGNPYEPLGEEARAYAQQMMNDYYGRFVDAVARNRGVLSDAVRSGFGEGRMVTSADAVRMGMVDGIETLPQLLARMGGRAEAVETTPPPTVPPIDGSTQSPLPPAAGPENADGQRDRRVRLLDMELAARAAGRKGGGGE